MEPTQTPPLPLQAHTAGAADAEEHALSAGWMFGLAVLVGIFGGFGSIAFSSIIAFFFNLFFYGQLSLSFDPDMHIAPSTWGPWIILVPVAGALLVTWLTRSLAPETRGHGVPEVMNAIYYKQGRIRPVVVLAKALTSAISIGTGGSVGREGPIIQIGSAFGSTLGQIIRMPTRQRIVLVGAGAAAGIAATFNAPIGGLAFALELMLVSISARTVALVGVATVTATYIGRLYHGMLPSFNIPDLIPFNTHVISGYSLLLSIPLGILMGIAAATFIRAIYWFEDRFDGAIGNPYLRHVSGMLMVGLLIYGFMHYTGQYYVAGVGYPTILDVLRKLLMDPGFLLLLCAAKLLATGLTLGSGASGGVFSPSLFLGATLGAAFGALAAQVFPTEHLDPALFAVAGMAAIVSGTTGAVITAITMTFEQTHAYGAMLPIILTVSLAYVVRVKLVSESIYTLKLVRRGVALPQGLQAAISARRFARTIMTGDYQVLDVGSLQNWQIEHKAGVSPRHTVFTRDGEVCGFGREDLQYLMRDENPEALIDPNFFVVTVSTPWAVLMRGLRAKGTERAIVMRNRHSLDAADVVGVITSREIVAAAGEGAELLD